MALASSSGEYDENQFGAGQPDGAIERATASDHDHFVLQAGGIGKLPDVFVVGAGHACGGCGRHCTRRAGGDDAGLGAGQLRQAPADRPLQFQHIDEMLRRFHLRLTNFRKFERPAQVSPRASAIDDGLHSQPGVYILARIFADGGGGLRVEVARGESGSAAVPPPTASRMTAGWNSGYALRQPP